MGIRPLVGRQCRCCAHVDQGERNDASSGSAGSFGRGRAFDGVLG